MCARLSKEPTVADLVNEWRKFCEDNKLPLKSADELLVDLLDDPSDWRVKYIEDFIRRWEEVV